MANESKYIWLNGEMVDFEKATFHFNTPALHYGLGAFEGIRCYDTPKGPAIFRLKDHLRRLVDSIKIFGLNELPYSVDELYKAALNIVTVNEFRECYIRPLVFFSGPHSLTLDDLTVNIGISSWKWGNFLGEQAMQTGVRLGVSSITRHHPNATMTKAKITGNYANSVIAKTLAKRSGFDDCVLLDPQGFVSEGSGENIFLVRKGILYTPPVTTALDGITRDSIITLANDQGYKIVEQMLSRDQLYIADEVFVVGTAAECVPVREIDFRQIGSGKAGPVTRDIQQQYQAAIHGNHPRSEQWLDYVNQA